MIDFFAGVTPAPVPVTVEDSMTWVDWVTTILTWIAALGATSGFAALLLTVLQNRRRRLVPPDDLRDLLLHLIEDFTSIITEPRPTLWFLEPDRQRRELTLAMLNGQLVDDELNGAIGDARVRWLECWTWAGPAGRMDARRITGQDNAAHIGREATSRAIERMNRLLREAR